MDPMKTTLDLSSTSDDDDNQAPTVDHPAETTTMLPLPPQATLHEFGSSSTAPPLSRPSPPSPQLALLGAQPPSTSFLLPPRRRSYGMSLGPARRWLQRLLGVYPPHL
ncbi:hypothetical protein SLE2022_076180 [Rubroshorea leprosula]